MGSKKEAQLRELAREKARELRIPEDLFEAMIQIESGFNPKATSPVGAMGLAQIMPDTARDLGFRGPLELLQDPETNLEFGSRYLRSLLDRTGDWELAAAAYNAGPGAVQKYGGIPPFPETQNYMRKLRKLYQPRIPKNLPQASMLRSMSMLGTR